MSFDDSSPDWSVFHQIIELRQTFLGMRDWGHPRYGAYPYPQRLCLLSDMNRVYVLREVGDIPKFLKLENQINNMPGKSASPQDNCILKMANWLDDATKSLVELYSDKEKVAISLLVYGKEYTKKCLDIVFKSMMTENNLPFMAKEKQVIFHLQTTEESKQTIENAPITARIKALGIHFEYAIIPEALMAEVGTDSVYWLVGAAATLGIEYARKNNAAFHHCYPDIVYSDKFFSELLRVSKLCPNILAPAHRTDQSILLEAIKAYENDDCIAVPSADLVALSLNALHMCHWPTLVNNRPGMWAYPMHHYLMWETHEFVHFNCPHLNAFWLAPETIAKFPQRFYISLDSELDFLCEGENYYIPQENDELYLVEFSNQGKQKVDDLYADAMGFANNFWRLSTNRDNFKFFVRGMKLRISRDVRPLHPKVFDENAVMNELVYLINTIQSRDPGVGTTLTRPRTHLGRVYGVTTKG